MGEIVERLRGIDLLSGLTRLQAAVLATFVETVEVPAGATVIEEGERSDELYIIESGQAEASGGSVGGAAVLGPGEYFGEIALLTGRRRTAKVVALTPLVTFKLTRGAYETYLSKVSPPIREKVSKTATRRQGESDGPDQVG
jgi:CRP-like cAMP-binding protein